MRPREADTHRDRGRVNDEVILPPVGTDVVQLVQRCSSRTARPEADLLVQEARREASKCLVALLLRRSDEDDLLAALHVRRDHLKQALGVHDLVHTPPNVLDHVRGQLDGLPLDRLVCVV